MASVDRLKKRLARTLEAKKVDGALEVVAALAELEPNNPDWPKRSSRLHRAKGDPVGEVAALRRALELQIEGSFVLDAIASCKAILEIEPGDQQSLDCLDRLHLNRGGSGGPSESVPKHSKRRSSKSRARRRAKTSRATRKTSGDAPLDSLVLTSVVAGSRSVALADAEPGLINEIPVDASSSGASDEVVDLRLEEWSSERDLAAAQAASLPSAADLDRSSISRSDADASLRVELANVPLFGDLDPASLHTLVRRVRVVHLEAGETLFRQGDAANCLYVIVEGAVVPIAEGERRRKLAVLERGQFFGEIGLMTRQPRNATIEGLVDSQLLAIDRGALWELIDKKPSVAKNILRFLRARLIDRQIRTNLFFAAFVHAEREAVARQFRVLEVADGTRIVEQGMPAEGLFVVLAGRLEKFDRDRDKSLGELGVGDVLGGLSLIESRGSSTDVIARGKCWLVVLGEARFRKIVDANPRLIRVLRRLAKTDGEPGDLPPVKAR